MADSEATVKVRLDTKQARADLAALGVEAKAAAGRVTNKLNAPAAGRGVSGGLGRGFGIGAAAGAGFGAAKGLARSLVGNPISEVVAEARSGIDATFAAGVGQPEARGRRRAREEARALFGRSGDIQGAENHFNAIKGWRVEEEKTMNEIDQRIGGMDLRDTPAGKMATDVIKAISDGFDKMIETFQSIGK